MFSYFHLLKKSRRGQIFPILVAVVVILIIATLITANLGKVSLDRLYTIQSADAGVLAGISDFVCGYNKAAFMNTPMWMVTVALQTWLLLPIGCSCIFPCSWCWFSRNMVVRAAKDFNERLYQWAREIVDAYSRYARKDAYYYAFINAGIDDKYKWDGSRFRDKPREGESWEHWTRLDSAFSRWLRNLPVGWEDNSSLTYNWYDRSKAVTVEYTGSPPQTLSSRSWTLWAGYCYPIPYVCACCLPLILPVHGSILGHIWEAPLIDPSTRWVRMTVRRQYRRQEKEIGGWTDERGRPRPGWWRVIQPTTQARARARMRGSFGIWDAFSYGRTFDMELEE
ncbi:MAG: hypothetical protein NC912_03785 [Candidatus Omnitrophica bacterium]|nr:hypothetical protein [Candidatus Omnitrophota bacterium]